VQAITERNRIDDPAAKGRVIRAGQHSVDGQAFRGALILPGSQNGGVRSGGSAVTPRPRRSS
jgi:hypothetical protein